MQSILDSKWLVFVKVAELGSLTRAAAAMGVPQSMVSRHLAQLEQQCGGRLFRRTGRGVVLSELGAALFPQLNALLIDAERIHDAIQDSGGVPVGEVRVGVLPSSVPLLATPLFSLAGERFPKVRLHLIEGTSTQMEEQLREGRLDMGLLLREAASAGEDEMALAQLSLQLVGRRGDALLQQDTIALSALQGLPLIVPSAPHALRARLQMLAEAQGLRFHFAVEADSIRLQHEIAAAGGGYAITSGLFELRGDQRLASARIVQPQLLRTIVLGTTLRRPHTLATREVQRLICEIAPALLKPES